MVKSIDEWVEERRTDAVRSAWAFAERTDVKGWIQNIPPTAMRTLLGAARQAVCVEEFKLVLRYQQAKARAMEKWPDALVREVEKEIDGLVAKARQAVAPEAAWKDRAEARLVAVWLAYVVQLHCGIHEAARRAAPQAHGQQGRR